MPNKRRLWGMIAAVGAAVIGPAQVHAQAPRTMAGAVNSVRAELLRRGMRAEHFREIATDSIPRTELECDAGRPAICKLADGQSRIRIRASRIGADSATPPDSVEVEIRYFENERSRYDGTAMVVTSATYVYNYVNGKWVRGRLVGALVK